MKYKKINLPFKISDLEPNIDTLTVETHYNKHHTAYENKFNAGSEGTDLEKFANIKEVMNNYKKIDDSLKILVRNAGGGLINHDFYWNQFVIKRELTEIEENIKNEVSLQFGSLDKFKEEVTNKGINVFGSGWVWLIKDENNYKIITTPNQENPWMNNQNDVILGIDLWEHAYYIKYKSNRKEYIDNIWALTIFR